MAFDRERRVDEVQSRHSSSVRNLRRAESMGAVGDILAGGAGMVSSSRGIDREGGAEDYSKKLKRGVAGRLEAAGFPE